MDREDLYFDAKCYLLIHMSFLLLAAKVPRDQSGPTYQSFRNSGFFHPVHLDLQMLFFCYKVEKYTLYTEVQ